MLSLVLSCKNSSRVSLKLRLAVTGVASLQSCIYCWRMQRVGGRVPGSGGKLDQFSPGSSLSPAALRMFWNATGTALADTISSLRRVFLSSCSLTANSHISLSCTVHCIRKVLQDQSCLCGLPCCFIKMIIGVATGLSKSKHAFGSACLHKTCCYSCAARTL